MSVLERANQTEEGISLTLSLPPGSNHYKRHFCTVKNIHPVRAVLTDETRNFRNEVALVGGACTPLQGSLTVFVSVYRKQKRGDLENFAKVLLDALQGYAYHNDSQIRALHMVMREDKDNPRVEVIVSPFAEKGE